MQAHAAGAAWGRSRPHRSARGSLPLVAALAAACGAAAASSWSFAALVAAAPGTAPLPGAAGRAPGLQFAGALAEGRRGEALPSQWAPSPPWARGARVPALARAGEAGEPGRLWLPDQQVVEAVQELGGRVTKADLLAQGVSAAGAERELLQLARASGATLQVNSRGELLFEFPEDLQGALRKRSVALRLRRAWQKATPWLSWGGRVAFGASLLATVALVYCAVLIVISTSSRQQDNDGNSVSVVSQNTFTMWFGQDLFFWLMPRPYGYYSYYGGIPVYEELCEPPPKMSFLESVFSFVFGDGDPNAQLDETRWQLIGECIAENGGAVVAEQIAPYLDPPSAAPGDEAAEQRALSQAMLPVLLRFRGRPEVGPEGDIVYVFPELQEARAAGAAIFDGVSTEELQRRLSAVGGRSRTDDRADIIANYRSEIAGMRLRGASPAEYLPERELKLTEAEDGQVTSCVAFGAFALLGTLYLGYRMNSPHFMLLARIYPVIALVVKIYPFLLAYTTAFLGIPLLRWYRMRRLNAAIEGRNEWRAKQADRLRQAGSGLRRRVANAAQWALRQRNFGEAVYDSGASASVRESRTEMDDLKSFDERLEGKS
mmetsp:Transcript_105536/g.336065  ORF Transcript_105536/g.336065 Transcript_105536/m.336065 type:complete len:602 (+) Transcript_105536:72-1877(+)